MGVESLPPPEIVIARIEACRDELAALKRLLRASQAAAQAEEARRRRQESPDGQDVGAQRS
jgi:hypothetical protein